MQSMVMYKSLQAKSLQACEESLFNSIVHQLWSVLIIRRW